MFAAHFASVLIAGLLTPPANAQNRALEATVEQGAPGVYKLRWHGAAPDSSVDIYVARQPYAERKSLQLLIGNVRDNEVAVNPNMQERPYFYVAEKGTGMWTAERVLPLQGGRNFRDLGGYVAANGRRVKWGRVYRSGSMAGLTPADYEYLSSLGIKVVCDLRTTRERNAEPNKWQEVAKLHYWSRDYETGFGELRKLIASGPTAGQAKTAMMDGYRKLAFEQAPAYREIFRRLAAGEVPLAFNCSAGKDRAGTAAALILAALGVPRETVVEDYALSDKVVDFRRAFAVDSSDKSGTLGQLAPEVVTAILSSDPDYIRAALDSIDAKHGSMERYLRDELSITAEELQAIRRQLLE